MKNDHKSLEKRIKDHEDRTVREIYRVSVSVIYFLVTQGF